MTRRKSYMPFVIVVLSVLYVILPLLGKHFIPTHDGEFHFIRFAEFFRVIASGYPFPRWAPGLNSGYGFPIFNFLYPLPDYIGSLFHLAGFGFVRSFFLSLAAAYVLSVWFSYAWLRQRTQTLPALTGALTSALVPYWFVDIYVRGAVGEVWAFVWMYLALYSVRAAKGVLLAVAVGLLILSHNIMAMILVPFLVGYAFLEDKKMLPWFIPGVFLSAYFWIPALYEKNLMIGLNTVSFSDHFADLADLLIPSWGTGLSGVAGSGPKMSLQIGIVPLFILILCTVLAFIRKNRRTPLTVYFLFWTFMAVLMTLPYSSPIWKAVPFIQYVQYPWRFLSVLIPVTAYLASLLAEGTHRRWVFFVLAIASFTLVHRYARPVLYEPRADSYYLSKPQFTDGTSSMGDSLRTIYNPPFTERPGSVLAVNSGKAAITALRDQYLDKIFSIRTQSDNTMVTAHIQYYPGWKVFLDAREIPVEIYQGMFRFVLPRGNHIVRIRFTETPVRAASDIISLGTLLFLAAYLIETHKAKKHKGTVSA